MVIHQTTSMEIDQIASDYHTAHEVQENCIMELAYRLRVSEDKATDLLIRCANGQAIRDDMALEVVDHGLIQMHHDMPDRDEDLCGPQHPRNSDWDWENSLLVAGIVAFVAFGIYAILV